MIVIIGATGNVGRPLVDCLLHDGLDVRAVSRDAGQAHLPADVEVVEADPRRPESLRRAFRGATAVFLNARATGRSVTPLLELAAVSGVRRAVALAASNVEDDDVLQPSRQRGDFNAELEMAVGRSGLDWVSLRPTVFASNYLALWSAQARAGTIISGPYGAAQSAPIDERDLAAVAARALTDPGLVGRRLLLTGPRSYSVAELVAVIGRAVDRQLVYQEQPPELARRALLAVGLPEGFVDGYLQVQALATTRPALVSSTVSEILGRPAITFDRWAADHRAAFGMDPSVARPEPISA
jgi:uncharacterized protein YbjT (DUF2867 family)